MFLDTPSLLETRLTLPPVSSQLRRIIIHNSALTGEPMQFGQGFKPSSVKALKASLISCLITFPDDCEIAKRITFFNSEKFPENRCCVYSNEVLVSAFYKFMLNNN